MSEASDWRMVDGLSRYLVNERGEVWSLLSGGVNRSGTARVSLMRDGVTHYKTVPALMAITFGSAPAGLSWEPIPGFPRYRIHPNGQIIRRMTRGSNGNGYPTVRLTDDSGRHAHHYIHALVCVAFHGLRPTPKHQVAHGDGVRDNCTPENLRWATIHENVADKWRHGTQPFGERCYNSKLSSGDVVSIRTRMASGDRPADLAAEFGVHEVTVSAIARGAKRRHG